MSSSAKTALSQAVRQAEAEGLTLLRSERSSSTGYLGVAFKSSRESKPYQAQVRRGGKKVSLGYFATPEEAALCYARTPEAQAAAAAPPEPPPLTVEEAVRQAEAEGLTLLPSAASGGTAVTVHPGKDTVPFSSPSCSGAAPSALMPLLA